MKKIIIFDTTLRDGFQSSGITAGLSEKIEIAKLLDELGVDKIELGFPFASKTDYEAIKKTQNLHARIFGLARPKEKDIQTVKESGCKSMHIFVPASTRYIKTMYKTQNEFFEEISTALKLANELKLKTELSLMDAPRADMNTIKKIIKISEKNQVEME